MDVAPIEEPAVIDGEALANDLEQELQCGCCSAIVYRPVVVSPCQHFFCGSCCVLWIKNGGTNCPVCRGISTVAAPSRTLQKLVDLLLRHAPSKVRPEGERMQADDVYRPGDTLRIPSPRQGSPEPVIAPRNTSFVHPCPHCLVGNSWGWTCPQPIVDPDADPDGAWHIEDGSPPGHAYCGNCENILSLQAPTTTRCDLCQVSFCGIGVPGRCVSAPIHAQHPHGFSDIADLIQCGEVYDCFDNNTVEVDYMLDYLTAKGITPRNIYSEIVAHIQSQPRQFAPLLELELFVDVHSVAGGVDPDPTAPRNRICRLCAGEILLYGLREWWVRERQKGDLPEAVTKRPDCPDGRACANQKDYAHAKEFNHILVPPRVTSQSAEEPIAHPGSSAGNMGQATSIEAEIPPPPTIGELLGFSSYPRSSLPELSSQDTRDEVEALL